MYLENIDKRNPFAVIKKDNTFKQFYKCPAKIPHLDYLIVKFKYSETQNNSDTDSDINSDSDIDPDSKTDNNLIEFNEIPHKLTLNFVLN